MIADRTRTPSFSTHPLVDFTVTIAGPIVIRPQGIDDGWRVTTVENTETMTIYRLETQAGCAPQLSWRWCGASRWTDISWKIARLNGTTHAERLAQVVRLARGAALTRGTEAA
jgi:hypothetical protein